MLDKIISAFNIFKRNRVRKEIKIYSLFLCFQGLSFRRISKGLLKLISKTSIHYNFTKLKQKLREIFCINKEHRKHIAIDETVIKANGKKYWIFCALDLEKRKIISLKPFPSRDYLSVLRFILEVKDKCINKDFVVITDRLPAYKLACNRLGINHVNETFGKRSLVESVFSSLKQVSKRFFNNVNVVFKKEIKRGDRNLLARRAMEILELFCLEFIVYFNYLRGDGY